MENKCPFCGASIQESARYCPFCMRELGEAAAKKKKTKIIFAVIFVVCLAALIAAGVLIGSMLAGDKSASDQTEEKASQTGSVTEETDVTEGESEELPYEEWPIITEYDEMLIRAIYLTAVEDLSELWDPDAFVYLETVADDDGDEWDIYENETFMDGVTVRTHFCEDGREILTSITGLDDENYSDGISVAECMISSVYNYTYTNLYDMLTDPAVYPRDEYEVGDDSLSMACLPDPWRTEDMSVEGSYARFDSEIGGQYLCLEFRTRESEGRPLYDIIITHTQDL